MFLVWVIGMLIEINVNKTRANKLAILGMEHTEVMSMEGIEAQFTNNELCGVSIEVERPNREVGHDATESLAQR